MNLDNNLAKLGFVLDASLTRHLPDECRWELPEGGLALWVTLPDDVDAEQIASRALDEKVAVSSSRFFYNGPPREQALRIAFALNTPDIAEEGVKRLGGVIRAALARRRDGRRTKARSRTALV